MRYAIVVPMLAVASLLAACSGDSVTPQPITRAGSAPSLRGILATSTGRLRPEVDSVALQRLLDSVPPETRSYVRAAFEGHQGTSMQLTAADPRMQTLIDAVTPGRMSMSAAQSEIGRGAWTAPVTLALVSGEGDSAVGFQRGAGANGRDVIVLHDGDLEARKLSAALRGLALLRRKDGVVANRNYTARVRVSQGRSESASWIAYLDQKIGELRAAPQRSVPGIGQARVLVIQSVGK